MLGQLLNWTPSRRAAGYPLSRGGSHNSQHGLESVTEDAHTQALLFPASSHPGVRDFTSDAVPGAFDESGPDSGLPTESDIRILVAQDETASTQKSLLFDSRPPQLSVQAGSPSSDRPPSSFNLFRERLPPNEPPSLSHSSTLPAHGRRSSQSHSSNDSRNGRNSLSSASSSFFRQSSDPPWQPPQRGHTRGQSNSSSAAGPSSRRLAKDADEEIQSCLECMFGSAALRYTGKTTKVHILSKDQSMSPWDRSGSSSAFTLQPVVRPTTSSMRPSLPRLHSRFGSFSDDKTSRKILITRVFSVQPRASDGISSQAAGAGTAEAGQPSSGAGAARPRRQPVYAISLLIRIPVQSSKKRQPKSPSTSDFVDSWSSSLISDSARSSHGSDSMLESTIFDTNFGSLSSLADALDDDDSMSSVTRHWIVIGKTLDQMQRAVEKQVLAIRDEAGLQLRRTGSLPGSLTRAPVPHAPQPEVMILQPHALAGDDVIDAAAESIAIRLGQVFTARQAVSGQGKWGIWKEEARWVDRWARTSEHSTLFTDLLSAFLATHVDWVETYEGGLSKRKTRPNAGGGLTSRTVILSNNKMKARRFIFLLAALLPKSGENASVVQDGTPFGSERGDGLASPVRLSRNSTSRTDLRPDQSAPTGLRRDSRDHGRRYSSRQLSNLSAAIELSRSGLSRSRTSTSFQSGSPGQDRFTTTDLNLANAPVAHFAPAAADLSLKVRRGSSASARLLENLQTIPSNQIASPQHSPVATRSQKTSIDLRERTPSVFGTSPSRLDTNESTITGPTEAPNRLEEMVSHLQQHGSRPALPRESSKLSVEDVTLMDTASAPRDIPTPRQKPSDPPDMPFSLSINEHDGFVDVDIPLDSYGVSLQSLSSRGHSERGYDAFPMPPRRATSDLAVGGYLQSFCQDLTLQAVKPYNNLENDLRSALSAESETGVSTRSSSSDKARSWPTKASILVVNIDTGDIRSLTLHAAPPASPKSEPRTTILDVITDDEVTPDTTDPRLASALSKILFTQPHDPPSRASSTRTRNPLTNAGAILSASPSSSAGTSVVGTPPGPGFSAMSDSVRGEGAGKVLFEALEEVYRAAKATSASSGGAQTSSLVRAVRERISAQ